MKKCIEMNGSPMFNELGKPMYSGMACRKYRSTGCITASVTIQSHKADGKYETRVNVPINIPKNTIGSIFSQSAEQYKANTFKCIADVRSYDDIVTMKSVAKRIKSTVVQHYDENEHCQYDFRGKRANSTGLAVLKGKLREINSKKRSAIITHVRKLVPNSDKAFQDQLVNRKYLQEKRMLSNVSVVASIQLSHNVYSDNYAIDNLEDFSKLQLDNYHNMNGTYSARGDKGLTFSIPCNDMDHASIVIDEISRVLNNIFSNINSLFGYNNLVDMNHRTKEQVAHDDAISAELSTEEVEVNSNFIADIEDETSTVSKDILVRLGIKTSTRPSVTVDRINSFDQ